MAKGIGVPGIAASEPCLGTMEVDPRIDPDHVEVAREIHEVEMKGLPRPIREPQRKREVRDSDSARPGVRMPAANPLALLSFAVHIVSLRPGGCS